MSHSVITLLSDLGTRDTSVSVAKAILIRHAPGATIVDISHSVEKYDLQQAAYLLQAAYSHFVPGSIHIATVNVFAGDMPRLIVAEKDGYYFIAPDNGILSLSFGTAPDRTLLCFEFTKPYSFKDWINKASMAIAAIHDGNTGQFKPCDIKIVHGLQPQSTRLGIDCNIRYIDRYENVVLDITKTQFEEIAKGRPFTIKIIGMKDITVVGNHYNDVPPGSPLCRFNSAGYLEIALNRASAAALFGLGQNNSGGLRYQSIKIFF